MKNKTKQSKTNSGIMKKNRPNVFIDAENVSGKQAAKIFNTIKSHYGSLGRVYLYTRQDDQGPKAWREYVKTTPELKGKYVDKRLMGEPAQNLVDKKIIKDMKRNITESDSGTIILVSSDHGYSDIAREARKSGHQFVGIGNKKASDKLIRSCDKFYKI